MKLRSLNIKFWTDPYIEDLNPIEKLLFIYFLTNPLTNLAGIYEIPLRRVAFETGIDADMVKKIIGKFSKDDKMYYVDGWIVIKNYQKNQKYNESMLKNVSQTLDSVPEHIKNLLSKETETHPLQLFIKENYKNVSKLPNQLSYKEAESLTRDYTRDAIKNVLSQMENYSKLGKYTSVNLTLRNWLKKEPNSVNKQVSELFR